MRLETSARTAGRRPKRSRVATCAPGVEPVPVPGPGAGPGPRPRRAAGGRGPARRGRRDRRGGGQRRRRPERADGARVERRVDRQPELAGDVAPGDELVVLVRQARGGRVRVVLRDEGALGEGRAEVDVRHVLAVDGGDLVGAVGRAVGDVELALPGVRHTVVDVERVTALAGGDEVPGAAAGVVHRQALDVLDDVPAGLGGLVDADGRLRVARLGAPAVDAADVLDGDVDAGVLVVGHEALGDAADRQLAHERALDLAAGAVELVLPRVAAVGHEGVVLARDRRVVQREAAGDAPGTGLGAHGDAAHGGERAGGLVDLPEVDAAVVAVRGADEADALRAEREVVAEVDVVDALVGVEAELVAGEVVDAQAAAGLLVGADERAGRGVGRVDPDGRVVGRVERVVDGVGLDRRTDVRRSGRARGRERQRRE